jgi:hypothetical protein
MAVMDEHPVMLIGVGVFHRAFESEREPEQPPHKQKGGPQPAFRQQ